MKEKWLNEIYSMNYYRLRADECNKKHIKFARTSISCHSWLSTTFFLFYYVMLCIRPNLKMINWFSSVVDCESRQQKSLWHISLDIASTRNFFEKSFTIFFSIGRQSERESSLTLFSWAIIGLMEFMTFDHFLAKKLSLINVLWFLL